MADETDIPVLPPQEALDFFRAKGFVFGFSWQDVWQSEHARAFTVAKAMSRDLLEDIRAAVDEAIAEGQTLKQFSDNLRPKLQARGWWGRRAMIDPLTGATETVQLGSPRRLRTIFNVNSRVAYETGKWERIRRTQKTFPFLRYTSVLDGRERPEHHAWHGTILPVDDHWWDTHTPPCGWNCRCTVLSYNQRQLDRRGLAVTENPVTFKSRPWTNKRTGEVTMLEDGIDAGWGYHIGKAPLQGLAPRPLPPGAVEDDATASQAKSARDFRSHFGLERDGHFIDKAGWPLAISEGWLRNLSFADQDKAVLAARAIADPDMIRLVWVTGKDGHALLFRRYTGHGWTADTGGAGWRWRRGTTRKATGLVVWERSR